MIELDPPPDIGDMTADEARAITDMTEKQARHLTNRIRAHFVDNRKLIKQAWNRRAWEALNYPSWDAYCVTEFDTNHCRLPKAERRAIVTYLRKSGMSYRAIAAAAGVDKNTVQADLAKARLYEFHTSGAAISDRSRDFLPFICGPDFEPPILKRRPIDDKRWFELDEIACCAARLYGKTIRLHDQIKEWERRWCYTTDDYELNAIGCIQDHHTEMGMLLDEMSRPTTFR
jgi:hypothetical protein